MTFGTLVTLPSSLSTVPNVNWFESTVYVDVGGLSGVAAGIASHARVFALVSHAHVTQRQLTVAISDVVVIGQPLAHLVPRDRGRRVAKQHDAHERDVTSLE